MTYLLHIDTSTDTGLAAISCDGCLLVHRTNEESRNHAGSLNNMIGELLSEAKISFESLSAIVVCGGPGSYTGLRIGMATAKGLCYALDKPLILDNRLTLLTYRAWRQNKGRYTQFITLLVARNKEYFMSIYNDSFTCTRPPAHFIEEQLADMLEKNRSTMMITDLPENSIKSLGINRLTIDRNIKTDPFSWAFFAFDEYKCKNFVNLSLAQPYYLKQVYTHK